MDFEHFFMEYGAYFKGTERPINVLMEKVIRKREDADGSIRVKFHSAEKERPLQNRELVEFPCR